MENHKRFHALIHGRVQGVGFRAFTQRKAEELGIEGWVRNVPSGEVEVEGEGPEKRLQLFLDELKRGPTFSQVDKVIVDWKESNRHTKGFIVRR